MAYQMSPPAQKLPPQPYSPYSNAASPPAQAPFAPPPAKRQRLSPDPRSPAAGSPAYAQSPAYSNPYSQPPSHSPYSPQTQSFAGSPPNSFNTPQPYAPVQWPQQQFQPIQQRPNQASPNPPPSSQMMPPPPRPQKEEKEERVGVEDIGDSLFGSGINLKDEENYLHNTWNNRHSQNDSFNTNHSTSFGSNSNNSFNYLTQGTSFGSSGRNGAAGTMGQAKSPEEIENELRRKREQAARRRAEQEQYHLNNQFLQGNCLRNRMHARATENAVRLDINGVYVKNPEPQQQPQVMVNADGTQGIAAVKNKPAAMIESGVAYEHILTLISLAASERMRGLLDEAYGLARARRYGDHGRVVPPEFADIATGEGKQSQETVVPESITGSQWDKTHELPVNGDTGDGQMNGVTSGPTPQPVQTVSFEGNLNVRLRELADSDKQAEKERQRKREARRRKAENLPGDEGAQAGTPAETSSETPATPAVPKVSKKEQSKKAKEAQQNNEKQSFTQSNATASMMAMGTRKKYSWMSGGMANMPTNRFVKPGGSGTTTPKAQPEPEKAAVGATKKDEEVKVPTWGDWREDDVHGKGIQLRDLVLALERDGREKKALQKALNKLT